jgi:hypothetical protein
MFEAGRLERCGSPDPGFAELLKDRQAVAPQGEAGWVFVNPDVP